MVHLSAEGQVLMRSHLLSCIVRFAVFRPVKGKAFRLLEAGRTRVFGS